MGKLNWNYEEGIVPVWIIGYQCRYNLGLAGNNLFAQLVPQDTHPGSDLAFSLALRQLSNTQVCRERGEKEERKEEREEREKERKGDRMEICVSVCMFVVFFCSTCIR